MMPDANLKFGPVLFDNCEREKRFDLRFWTIHGYFSPCLDDKEFEFSARRPVSNINNDNADISTGPNINK